MMVANPILYKFGILHNWKDGDTTIDTLFKNNIDFYFSFQIGIAVAIAAIGLYKVFRSVQQARKKARESGAGGSRWAATKPPEGRGDIKTWIVIMCYLVITAIYTGVSAALLYYYHDGWTAANSRVIGIILLLGFVYTPFISYVTARLEGMVGQAVAIPFVKEASLILSGYQGIAVWFLPIPMANYGAMTVFYRQCELTGTKFTSIWKTQLILYPVILVSSIFFMNFIWSLDPVPSAAYPFAEMMWELQARNQCIMLTSTLGEYSMFEQAFNWTYLGCGTGFGVVLFTGLSWLGAPIMLVYGLIRGLGQSMPHVIIPQFIGALIGRYYFQKKLKLRWRQYIPVVSAGFACGMGLITTVGVGITFLSKAVIRLPF